MSRKCSQCLTCFIVPQPIQARPDDITILVNQLNRRVSLEKSRPVPVAVAAAVASASPPVAQPETTTTTSSPDLSPSSASASSSTYLDPAVVDMKADHEDSGNLADASPAKSSSSPNSSNNTSGEADIKNGQVDD